jgi:alpha-tubulin suppressor-like RCC1 family protein/beta-lactamase regulating signal transducer with metallopeptidase domain
MKDLFVAIFNMSIMAGIVACVVMVIRFPLKKAPKVYSYVLWTIVLFRLVCPFTIESPFSLLPARQDILPQGLKAPISQNSTFGSQTDDSADDSGLGGNDTANSGQTGDAAGNTAGNITNAASVSFDLKAQLLEIAAIVWMLGIAVLLGYALFSYIRLKSRVQTATLVKVTMYETIYETDRITSPFVLGFIEPKIYLPIGIKDIEYVINHEEEHIRRRDYLMKPIALMALCLHWFNPVIWLSYFQMCKDMEMSCDERVLKRSGADIRKDYSGSLVSLAVKQSGLAIPLAFGESNVKKRVKHVLKYKKAPHWIRIASIFIVLAVTMVLASTRAQSGVLMYEGPGSTSASTDDFSTGSQEPFTGTGNAQSSTIAVGDYGLADIGEHKLAIKRDGSLWAWGYNQVGQIGNGTNKECSAPVKVMSRVASVSANIGCSMAIKTDGSLWAWGKNDSGQLGDGTNINRNAPVKVMENVVSVSVGDYHAAAIRTDGTLWMWGYNVEGQLGDGTTMQSSYPIKVMSDVITVSCGNHHTAAIKTDGSLWVWGRNMEWQLGDGTNIDRLDPVKIMDDVADVSAGGYYSLAVKTDGSLWAWGYCTESHIFQSTPVKIMDDAAACQDGMVIKTDGSLWTWGTDFSKTPYTLIPYKMADDVVQAAGFFITMAVKADGSLWKLGHDSKWVQHYGYEMYRGEPIKEMKGVKVPGNLGLRESGQKAENTNDAVANGKTVIPNIDSSQIPAVVINKEEFESQFNSVEHMSIQPSCWFPLGNDKVTFYDGNLATTTFAGQSYPCVSVSSEAYDFMQNNKTCVYTLYSTESPDGRKVLHYVTLAPGDIESESRGGLEAGSTYGQLIFAAWDSPLNNWGFGENFNVIGDSNVYEISASDPRFVYFKSPGQIQIVCDGTTVQNGEAKSYKSLYDITVLPMW